ncbi:sacsin N-terminal ATP-binding-like domain-containing protein [Actinophytocola glycyrrhizae]|uniref:Sacsin N-terminal ATP-binding-like domain-containing protein n=1 Tax=Actinophytocola glycyrrhizae TaxID=2044873 RepID=A0ABV9S081_9PSEU
MTDPFGTAALRESVLGSWRSSPTRLREDTNAEEDLVLGGYRDRLLIELAQNAADAAGTGGVLRVSLVDGELRVANTGEPLTRQGVEALASLRASAKQHGVGRFGVGFAAVLTVTDAPRIVSTSGGVAFDAERTRREAASDRVPVLRLPWPTDETPPDGFATEVRLPLRDTVDLDVFRGQAVDILLSLDALTRIEIDGDVWWRDGAGIHGPDGVTQWVVVRDHGELPPDPGLGAEARLQWTVCWALRMDGGPLLRDTDVLHAPTPTDERLSLPARLIASLPVEPSRRRVRPGVATDQVLAAAARAYPRLLDQLEPGDRPKVVPLPRFPLSEVDEKLRDGVLKQLRVTPWLPSALDDKPLTPAEARLLPVPSAELAESVAPYVPGLVRAEFVDHVAALAALDVVQLRLSDVIDALTGITRPPAEWRVLYEALGKIVDNDPSAADDLGALPVPLADGRTVPGPRGVLIADLDLSSMDNVHVVHPDAVHPLLERLGAQHGGAEELLAGMASEVEHSIEDAESGLDTSALANTVLRLVTEAGIRPGDEPWLGALALRDTDGDPRRADELALPGTKFLTVLAEDSPVGVLAEDIAAQWSPHVLAAVGVLDRFTVVVDEAPTGPDHDLADETDWWDDQPEPPARLEAVRDLDLVADDAWPAAIRLLASEPDTWRVMRSGYTAWWIAHHALLAGEPPAHWRLPDARELTGLYDVAPADLEPHLQELMGVRAELSVESTEDAEDLLDRLSDPARTLTRGMIRRAYTALADAVRDDVVDPADLDPPPEVRTTEGEVTDNAAVLDVPWLAPVTDGYVAIDADLAVPLAELLDIPVASEAAPTGPDSTGEPVRWADLGAVVDVCDLIGIPVPPGGSVVHDGLTVGGRRVPWWVAGETVHCEDSSPGLGRALAWVTDRWADRHLLTALLEDPENHDA